MILVSHPTGNTFVKALLKGLADKNELDLFYTTFDGGKLSRFVPAAAGAELARRTFPIPSSKVRTHAARELVRLLSGKLHIDAFTEHESGWASTDRVIQDLDRFVAHQLNERLFKGTAQSVSAVYSYEDGCAFHFEVAKNAGRKCFYELPIAYFETSRRLLTEESDRLPDWERTLGGTRDSEAKLQRKQREIELADAVICPSEFVLDSIPSNIRNAKPCVVAPFGTPTVPKEVLSVRSRGQRDHLRVLFAGGMSQRKGLADVFSALRLLNRPDVELVVMGTPLAEMDFYRRQAPPFTYEPPRHHEDVLKLMSSCDVFVLPSIVEGRALVMQEAMSCGLPLIVTPNTGGSDLVEEGKTGFLVPIRSPQEIAEKLSWFAEHRPELAEMRHLAREKALQFTWDNYCNAIFGVLFGAGN
jgi:glycosyltransferase involved in cell wall biosynthesis